MKSTQDLFDLLNKLKIVHETHYHKPLFTCEEADKEYDLLPAFGRCKNLFLKDSKKRLWLIVALSTTKINLKELSKKMQAPELRFANNDLLLEYLGVQAGSVTPFGLINDTRQSIHIILDDGLFSHQVLGFHPLSNDATTLITPTALCTFINHCGCKYQNIDFS